MYIFHNEINLSSINKHYILIVLGFLWNTLLCFAFLCQKKFTLYNIKGEYLCCTKIFLNSPAFDTEFMNSIDSNIRMQNKISTKNFQKYIMNLYIPK